MGCRTDAHPTLHTLTPFPMPAPPQFPCTSCGANLKFAPGTNALRCPYCGSMNEIEADTATPTHVAEQDYKAYLADVRAEKDLYEVMTIKCNNCGSETTLDPNVTADACSFCGTSYVNTAQANRLIKPQAMLPFKVTRQEAREAFRSWISSLWFAPNALKQLARQDSGIDGLYLPHWTYDAHVTTDYVGRRGEHYYVTVPYTVMVDGKPQRRTRQEQRTRWYPAQGRVYNTFDDVLVNASNTLPREYVAKLEPWDLQALVPYDDAYQSGFRTESYGIDLEGGFGFAQKAMEPTIYTTIHRDIGGDVQQVSHKQSYYDNITFKHILLPLWISAYRFGGKTYRFLVNARTGEVQGERPYSWIKITLLVLLIIVVVSVFVVLNQGA